MAPRIVVTDAAQRVALEVVRCLGRAGYEVVATERLDTRRVPTFRSRYCSASEQPDPGEEQVDFLLRMAKTADALIPISTNTVLAVAEHAESFAPHTRILLPPVDTIRRAMGKQSIVAAANTAGVPAPRTRQPESEEELSEVADEIGFPLIVKLADDEGLFLAPAERYGIARDTAEFRTLWRKLSSIKPKPVVQERIVGPGYGFSTVLGEDGTCLGAVSHRRIREYPVSGGPSTCCVSVDDAELRELSLALLRFLDWVGPAMVEYKRDERDGTFRLIEINPRFWGSIPLARFSGLNLPAALIDNLLTGAVPERATARPDVKMRILPKDVLAGVGYLAAGQSSEFFSFAADLLDPRIKPGLFDTRDPLPAFLFF